MLRFSIRVVSLLAIGLVQISCAAPPDAMTLRGPSMSTALASGRSSALMGRVLAPSPERHFTNGSEVLGSASGSNQLFSCVALCSLCNTPGSGPQGVMTGQNSAAQISSDYLYVALEDASEILVVEPFGSPSVARGSIPPCTVVRTLYDPGYYPAGVAGRRDGLIAVTNICSAPSCGTGNIAFYDPGQIYPSYYASSSLISQYYFGDFDRRGNFYNDGLNASGETEVGVVPLGSTSDNPSGITGISFPGGIQVARNGTVNIDDQGCPCIQIYKGSSHVGTISLPGITDPVTFALDKKNHYFWVTDYVGGTIDQFHYPSGVSAGKSFSGLDGPIGVAVIPPDNP